MSERGQFRGSNRSRGRGGGPRGGGSAGDEHHHSSSARGGGHHAGSGGDGRNQQQQQSSEKPKKENILDLSKHVGKKINVKFSGGREVFGTLKGHDQLLNLVLEDVEETLKDESGTKKATRKLGLVVARGTLLTSISPLDGREQIANPFGEDEGDEEEPE